MLAPRLLTPNEADRLIREAPATQFVDVRTLGEYESAHIAEAHHILPNKLGEHANRLMESSAAATVLVCQSGQRAHNAHRVLSQLGVSNLYVLDGGMNAWISAKLPVRYGKRQKISLERQVRIIAGSLAATGGFLGAFVDPGFALIPAFIGCGLVFAGVTDICMLGMLLGRLPYNSRSSCGVGTK